MIIQFLFFIFLVLVFGTMIFAGFSAAPWLPSWKKDIVTILAQAEIKSGDTVYDLGSGDGRWLFAVAKKTQASKVVGYEISVLFYLWSRIKLLFTNYPQIEIKFNNFYYSDFSKADVILCFLTPRAMKKMSAKLNTEMKPGSKLISYAFSLPGKEPKKRVKLSKNSIPIYLYIF